jgi:tetratricopeptide (TPR) repeat protein
LATIERGYRAHLRQLSGVSVDAHELHIPLACKGTGIHPRVRRFDDAEVHALWAFFLPFRADEQLGLAQQHDRESAHTYLLQGMIENRHNRLASAMDAFDRAVALAPSDPFILSMQLVQRLVLEADKPRAERKLASLDAEVRRLAQTADEKRTLLIVASYGALGGDAAFALPYALRAVALDPASAECEAVLAQLYFRTGDFAHAVEAEVSAFRRLPLSGRKQEELACYRRAAAGEAADCAW